MKNIWFVRMDLNTHPWDFNEENPYICSNHGTCASDEVFEYYKPMIFPNTVMSISDIRNCVKKIKLEEGIENKDGCDLAISYWILIMNKGDIVFIRNRINEVYLGIINSYLSEFNYQTHKRFSRHVNIIKRVDETLISKDVYKRTSSRKAIERNDDKIISEKVLSYVSECLE